jgi:hypothetical protein
MLQWRIYLYYSWGRCIVKKIEFKLNGKRVYIYVTLYSLTFVILSAGENVDGQVQGPFWGRKCLEC